MRRRRRGILAAVVLSILLPLAARAQDPRAAARRAFTPLLVRLHQALTQPPPPGEACFLEADVRSEALNGEALVAWDDHGRMFVRFGVEDGPAATVAVAPETAWIFVPGHGVLFRSERKEPADSPPTAGCRVWPVLRSQITAALAGAALAPIPDGFVMEETEPGRWRLEPANGDWAADLRFDAKDPNAPIRIDLNRPFEAQVVLKRWSTAPVESLKALLEPSGNAARIETVRDDDLRSMVRVSADMLAERAILQISPKSLPSHFPGRTAVQGKQLVVFRGTPEEIGRAHGTMLRTAVRDNIERVLFGIGFGRAVLSGTWLPDELEDVWEIQQRWISRKTLAEIDAMADAAGLPRRLARLCNIYPEMFHCSGMALRGEATADGRILHGRILDYLTEGGLQLNAVIMVFVPEKRHAWVNIGYAGCVGSVTAMNETGLTMGEMGGGGEGYVDGIPMMFLVREVVERFDNVRDAVDWIRLLPRTCEYFYVLSDSGRDMVALGSWARALAGEKGVEDLLVLNAGEAHPLLPTPLEDCVLLSAGKRYRTLVERVRADYGTITPDVLWEIMGEGVAMKSCLHIALFQPETLDFWVADAGPRAEPAWSRPRAEFNLGEILAASTEAGAQ